MTYKSNQIITMQGGTRKVLGVFTNAGGGESIYFLSKLKKYDESSRQPWTAKQIEREEIKERRMTKAIIESIVEEMEEIFSTPETDFIRERLAAAFTEAVKNEKKKMKETHICRFNDGEQDCVCYNAALDAILHEILGEQKSS